MRTLGERLLRRLRARVDRSASHSVRDILPAVPTELELRGAVAAAAGGRSADTERLAGLLLAVARCDDVGLVVGAERILTEAPPRLWTSLDVSARRCWWHAPVWSGVLIRRLLEGDPRPLELALAACHPDGHVREAAVARLSELDHVLVPPVLALRAADWVPQVRDRARLACRQRLADAFLTLAPVAFALRERRAGGWLADALDTVLREGPAGVLGAALSAADWRTRRIAYQVGVSAGRLTLAQLLRAARTDTDLPIRIRCAEAAIRIARAGGNLDAARELLGSRAAAVRAEAVHALGTAGDARPAKAALTDRSALVRATAQVILRRAGLDPAAAYRAIVADQRPPDPAAIAGLGETGTGADAEQLHRWLTHPRPRGRAEAVRALRRLGQSPTTLLLPLLTDPAPTVTRQVTLSLRAQAGTLDEAFLHELLHTDQPRHIRVAAYRLLRVRDTWTRLAVDLHLVDDPQPALRHQARNDLANWLNREAATTYSMPTGIRAHQLCALLTQAEVTLGTDRIRLLRFHLGLRREGN